MAIDAGTDVDSLTLPELLSAAELAGRRLKEHLQYDLVVKSRELEGSPTSAIEPLLQSRDLMQRLFSQWKTYNDAVENRIQRILSER